MHTLGLLQQQAATPRATPAPRARFSFDPSIPAVYQTGPWQCSAASTAWVLQALGFSQTQDDVVRLLGNAISADVGLHFGDGRDLVALLQSLGLPARSGWLHTFEDLQALAGRVPLAMGSATMYHWVAVRGVDGDVLQLANPDRGLYRGVGQTLDRGQFAEFAPFAGVWVEV
ncbi:MAG TPA: hypothetical protein VF937_07155 [Chloroflexota bacterium]